MGWQLSQRAFSPLNLSYTTSVKVQMRSDVPNHAILDAVCLPGTLNWFQLVNVLVLKCLVLTIAQYIWAA